MSGDSTHGENFGFCFAQLRKGGFEVFRDDPGRGAMFPTRLEKPLEPSEFVAAESPRNETEALWENFLECVRTRNRMTFAPVDLAAAAAMVTAAAG